MIFPYYVHDRYSIAVLKLHIILEQSINTNHPYTHYHLAIPNADCQLTMSGNYIDVYDMSQAVDDGAPRPVYYESRVVNLNLDEDTMNLLNDEFDNLADEGATEEQIRQAKQEHSRLEVLLGEDATIDTLVRDIVKYHG